MRSRYYFAGMEAQRCEGGRRILVGDNTDGGAYLLKHTVHFEFGFQLDCLAYTYTGDHLYTQFRLEQNSTSGKLGSECS
jgi:hypothetical protein